MHVEIPSSPTPRRPHGPRDPGDAWVVGPHGERYWGRFGAAGLLAHDPRRGVLLQHRAEWSHHGGSWGIPGGARHAGEDPVPAALREAREEAAVPSTHIRPLFTTVFDLGYWSYATLVAEVADPFEARVADQESIEFAWVPDDTVESYPLHPGFALAWPRIRPWLGRRPYVIAAADAVRALAAGTDPDAPARLGVPGAALGRPGRAWFPDVVLIVREPVPLPERAAPGAWHAGLTLIAHAHPGEDGSALADQARRAIASGVAPRDLFLVSDAPGPARALASSGAHLERAAWLREAVDGRARAGARGAGAARGAPA